jgi:2-oxoglutarate ferredoxin oxidoreductase subunit gamma
MLEQLLIAGSGGQGIGLIGRLLASASIKSIPHLTFLPAYGAEVRGGTSNCQVILSSNEIASPVAEKFDSMIIMSQESADKFLPRKHGQCLALINSSLCRVPRMTGGVAIGATDLANELGDVCVANFIMLGAYLARKPVVLPATVEECTKTILAGKRNSLIDMNIHAFRVGLAQ